MSELYSQQRDNIKECNRVDDPLKQNVDWNKKIDTIL